MRCPQCQTDDDKVIETRVLANGAIIRRRRQCNNCDARFTSYERIEAQMLTVIKKNNRREEFDREKLEKGLLNAIRKRPIPLTKIKNILDTIEEEAWFHAGTSKEIHSSYLGTLVTAQLYEIDPVAYLRFASVYRNFETIEEFVKEIKELNKNPQGKTSKNDT